MKDRTALRLPRTHLVVAALLALGLLMAYANALHAPFVFDDVPSLVQNRTLDSLRTALTPPTGGLTVSGRPLLNLSFALDRTFGGTATWSYRVGNLAIHFGAALLLFGLVRRTLAPDVAANRVAGATALLWALHPLQTESVTYVVQRAESLAGLFILAALYAGVRARTSRHATRWSALAIGASFAGVATKETAAVIPVLVLLYDRTFVHGSFRAALAARRRLYAGLAASWLLLAALGISTRGRGGSVVVDDPATTAGYLALQLPALAHYARLALWPSPLVFDYGPYLGVALARLWPGAIVALLAVGATVWLLVRRPRAGFVAATFFVVLVPSSSFVPVVTQIMAEHRLYLALASLVFAAVWAGDRWLPRAIAAGLLVAATFACLALTMQRNRLYRSPPELWRHTTIVCPDNPRGHLNLGEQLSAAGRTREAIAAFATALRIDPNYVTALYNLGTALIANHRPREALAPLRRTLELKPDHAEAAYNLGNAYAALGDHTAAIAAYTRSLRTQPDRLAAHYNLANSLLALERLPEAIAHLQRAAALAPDQIDVHFNLANALFQNGQPAAAIPEYETVLRLNPRDTEAANNLRLARAALRGKKD